MRRLLLSVATATLLVIGPSAESSADDPLRAFEFRGHHIGESIDTNFPYWAQGSRGLDGSSHILPFCGKEDNGTVECEDMTVDDIGGAKITGFGYEFFDDKLFGLSMGFYTAYYDKVRGLLEGKYGKPTAEYNQPIQNMAGVTFDNIVTEWKFPEGVLKLHMRFSGVYNGALIFENPTVEHEIEVRYMQRLQTQGRKAF